MLMPATSEVLLVVPSRIPWGGAQSTRIQLIADGLAQCGWRCRILGRAWESDRDSSGEWQHDPFGTPYINIPALNGSQLGAAFQDATRRAYQESPFDVLIAYGPSWAPVGPSLQFAQGLGVKTLVDCTEWYSFKPWSLFKQGYRDHLQFRRRIREQSGALAISSFYERYIQRAGVPTFRLPALCSPDVPTKHRSASTMETRNGEPLCVGYFGGFDQRNLPMTMLKSIKQACGVGVDLKFQCYGYTNSKAALLVKKFVSRDPVLSRTVELNPYIRDRKANFDAIVNCDVVLLLRDDGTSSRACFPTRLVEFLMTGVPVITSRVPDISDYLKHGHSAYIVDPGDVPDQDAEAIKRVASDPDAAESVGKRGATVAVREFNHIAVCKRLDEWTRSTILQQ